MKRVLRVIPLLVVIAFIFFLTMQNKEQTVALSNTTLRGLIKVCETLGIDTETEWWNTAENVRCLGHVAEYFVLGLTTGIVFKRKRYALLICVIISIADQIAKVFVPVRHFDWSDIPFDVVGMCSAIAIIGVIKYTIHIFRGLKKVEKSYNLYEDGGELGGKD